MLICSLCLRCNSFRVLWRLEGHINCNSGTLLLGGIKAVWARPFGGFGDDCIFNRRADAGIEANLDLTFFLLWDWRLGKWLVLLLELLFTLNFLESKRLGGRWIMGERFTGQLLVLGVLRRR